MSSFKALREDQENFDRQKAAAELTVEKCRAWLAERLPGSDRQNLFFSSYRLAPTLKKLAKKYDFKYRFLADGLFALEKKTERGHYFRLGADCGPSRVSADFWLEIEGLGFRENLHCATYTPTNQEEFDACAEQAAETAAQFVREMLPELDGAWPETPEWFTPSL